MIMWHRGRTPGAGRGSGISIGGDNTAPLQNVVGQNVSHVHQSTSLQSTPVDLTTLRGLLDAVRADTERHAAELPNLATVRGMLDDIDTALTSPAPPEPRALSGVIQALPALVAGTAVQQTGEALARALAGWGG